MKKIIARKRYDTTTATLIAEWRNGLGGGDFRNCAEDLYRTAGGAFFIHGDGGAMTRWSRAVGDMTGGGEGIEPLTEGEALEWCEEHGRNDVIEAHFGSLLTDA